jgi:hypothetical protein
MKTKMDGWAYTKDLTYELQVNFADSANVLEDANINYDFTKGRRRSCRWPVQGASRQELTSQAASSSSTDRRSRTLSPAADIGLQAWGTPLGRQDRLARRAQRQRPHHLAQRQRRLADQRAPTWQPFGDVSTRRATSTRATSRLAVAAQYEANSSRSPPPARRRPTRRPHAAMTRSSYKGFSFGEY